MDLSMVHQQQQAQVMPQMLSDNPDDMTNPSYYPQEPSDVTGGLPINLDSLRDGPPGTKPFYPYSTLIRYAIKGSPNQKLLLEDIYYAIESRFPYFKDAPNGWKNSVRHNLSLNPCFEKVPRPLTDRGKGSYWTVNDHVDPRTGVHRVRKKKPSKSKSARGAVTEEEIHDVDYAPTDGTFDQSQTFVPPPPMDQAGSSREIHFPYPPFDPNFPMMPPGIRFFPPVISPEENFDVDEHGNVDWRMAWLKELDYLRDATTRQEKAGTGAEWYRMMLIRVRSALMPPLNIATDEMVNSVMPQPMPDDVQQQ